MHLAHRDAGGPGDLVDIDRARPERADDPLPLALHDVGQGLGDTPSSGADSSGPNGSTGRPRIGARASTMSRAEVTRQAPCLRRLLVPAERGSRGLPGTAKTSRPCSPAKRAVISEPDRSAASTTTTPIEMPEIRRLRRGKSLPLGAKPGLRSLSRSPCSPMAC